MDIRNTIKVLLPTEWTTLQLQDAVVSVTSLRHQTTEVEFTLVVVCLVKETADVKGVIENTGQYNHIQDCYFHVKSAPKSAGELLTSTVRGLVVANRLTPTEWKWKRAGTCSNFLDIKMDKSYRDLDTNEVVDKEQKPYDLYEEIILTVTTKQQWVMDLCCGTGTGLLAALQNGRNVIAVDNSESMVLQARGRYYMMYQHGASSSADKGNDVDGDNAATDGDTSQMSSNKQTTEDDKESEDED
ncbi:uncharacterized protein [Amphiura filiformis]|uniref:uncharacterized protein n=1 Tax=Amphiura filiformis TaxID=82378 RepID=UPI003B20F632